MDAINPHTEYQMNATSQSSGFAHCLVSSESVLPVKNLGLTVLIIMCTVHSLVVTEERSKQNKQLWIQDFL